MNERVCICIAGWHFPEQFFRSLTQLKDVDLFLISHQPSEKIPAYVFSTIPASHLFIEPNYGYDWGCYQQFLEKDVWKKYTHVVFMHDDLIIKCPDFIHKGIEMLKGNFVLGNHRPTHSADWPSSHPESYFHASWHPSQPSFVHDVVRGSFFMATAEALVALECFEVFWDRFHASLYFGNWSLRATSAKWQARCGPDCFEFFSEKNLESDYIVEMTRGGMEDESLEKRVGLQNLAMGLQKLKAHILYVLTRHYMLATWGRAHQGIMLPILARGLRYVGSRPSIKEIHRRST
ncbi:MAG: hypothetical protein D3914_00075 [Candidatus Electrothrix sp. LOE2]|nr:hypothetical protein [Candidatus Electrothrix sp. LOE2]